MMVLPERKQQICQASFGHSKFVPGIDAEECTDVHTGRLYPGHVMLFQTRITCQDEDEDEAERRTRNVYISPFFQISTLEVGNLFMPQGTKC